jgi:hypothetical protein
LLNLLRAAVVLEDDHRVDTALVLGADCGGSTSRVVAATVDGRIVGRVRAGASNPLVCDARAAAAELARRHPRRPRRPATPDGSSAGWSAWPVTPG